MHSIETVSLLDVEDHSEPLQFDCLHELHIGTVRVADETGGFSKVSCPNSGFGCDVHVHGDVADPEVLAPDDVVAFKIHVGADGVPQAAAPFWKLMGSDGQRRPAAFGTHCGRVGDMGSNGRGFVACPEVSRAHGSDPLYHDSILSLCFLTPGDTIAFDVHVEGHGKPWVCLPLWRYCWTSEVFEQPNREADQAVADSEPARVGKRPVVESGRKRRVLPQPKEMLDDSRGKAVVIDEDEAMQPHETAGNLEPSMKRARADVASGR